MPAKIKIVKKYYLLFACVIICIGQSCKKNEGVGGDASIRGKVFCKHYNTTFSTLISSYYIPDQYVYIIYGDDISYGQRIKTNYSGAFEFKYLYKGDYTIYTYSIDSAYLVNNAIPGPDSAVVKTVNIGGRKDHLDLGDLVVFQ